MNHHIVSGDMFGAFLYPVGLKEVQVREWFREKFGIKIREGRDAFAGLV